MELGTGISSRYKKITFWKEAVDELLVNAFIESHQEAPAEIVLDMDTTDMPLHGKQEGRFFHGYYDSYCYLPLYVFCGDHVLCARMREANHDAAFGCRQEMQRIVKQLRTAWPEVKIVLRGDSGFCRNELMSWQGPPPAVPVLKPGGVVPAFSSVSTIQAGEWVSIYGTNLANSTTAWNGTFTSTLGGASVTINGKPAWLSYVSPQQINMQAPDDTATGSVTVVVATAGGRASGTVTLARFAPSLLLLDDRHVAGIIRRSDGSGVYGGGSYDIIGPTGSSLGYKTMPAKAGDIIELYAVGLGPTNPVVAPGQPFTGSASTTSPVSVLMNGLSVTPSFSGLSGAGLCQVNLVVPAGPAKGDVPLSLSVGGVQTQSGVVISLQ